MRNVSRRGRAGGAHSDEGGPARDGAWGRAGGTRCRGRNNEGGRDPMNTGNGRARPARGTHRRAGAPQGCGAQSLLDREFRAGLNAVDNRPMIEKRPVLREYRSKDTAINRTSPLIT